MSDMKKVYNDLIIIDLYSQKLFTFKYLVAETGSKNAVLLLLLSWILLELFSGVVDTGYKSAFS